MKAKVLNTEDVKDPGLITDTPSKDQEPDQLPPDPQPQENQDAPPAPSREETLQNEINRLKSDIESLKTVPPPAAPTPDPKEQQDQAQKTMVQADINALDDDDFKTKYNMSKFQAHSALQEYEFKKEKQSNSQRIAELEAKSELERKYPEFSRLYGRVQSVLNDLSPESRRQTDKIRAALEREFIYIQSLERPRAPADGSRRTIVNDFTPPTPRREAPKNLNDEIDPEYRETCEKFGITKESERKRWMSPWIPTHLGRDSNGDLLVIDDPKGKVKKIKSQ